MRRVTLMLGVLLLLPLFLGAQQVFESFDLEPADTTFWYYEISASADPTKSFTNLSYITDPAKVDGAMRIEYGAHNSESWGGYSKIEHWNPDSNATWDFSAFDSISFWYYNEVPQSAASKVHLRFELYDVSDAVNGNKTYSAGQSEFYYSFHYILDNAPGWNEIKMVLKDGRTDPELDEWGGEAFNRTGWAGIAGNDILDLDKIKGYGIEFSIGGGGEGDESHGTVILDHITLKGAAEVAVIFFNGRTVQGGVTLDNPWSGSVLVEEGAGAEEGTNALKWDVGQQWSGPAFTLGSAKNLLFSWSKDTLNFKIKAPADFGPINLFFADTDEDGAGTDDYPFEATYMLQEAAVGFDGTWKQVKIPLNAFNRFAGVWWVDHNEPGEFDSTRVKRFGMTVAGGDRWGNTVYLDDIWTGHPSIDNQDPEQVQNVAATINTYFNTVSWDEVPNETDETYTVYAHTEPITDVTDPDIDVLGTFTAENRSVPHYLRYPLVDTDVDYYYAVTCTDAAGNTGLAGMSAAPTTNTALGIPTISLTPPAEFAADGDLTEWYESDIMPFVLSPENGYIVPSNGNMGDADDLTGTIYIAVDDDFLYVAADVVDDVYFHGEGNWWDQDALQFFIGLYDWRGAKHKAYMAGDEPDYSLAFNEVGVYREPSGRHIYTTDSEGYYFEGLNPDWLLEAKISLDSMRFGDEARFHPVRGMRIPMELYFHDNDGSGWEANLAMSPYNTDQGWNNPGEWVYSWIGDTTHVATAIEDGFAGSVVSFELKQNYPNPFNPVTSITYSLATASKVQIDVFNVLGQKVKTLVNARMQAGVHVAQFDGSDLSSGVYFYKISAGDFIQTKKMLLVK